MSRLANEYNDDSDSDGGGHLIGEDAAGGAGGGAAAAPDGKVFLSRRESDRILKGLDEEDGQQSRARSRRGSRARSSGLDGEEVHVSDGELAAAAAAGGGGAGGAGGGDAATRALSDLTMMEMIEIFRKVRARLDVERLKSGHKKKMVDLKLQTSVGASAAERLPLFDAQVNVEHLSADESGEQLVELKAPEDARSAVVFDVPISDEKRAKLNAGKVLGKIFLVLDQQFVKDRIAVLLPSLCGKTRQSFKDDDGKAYARIVLFFSEPISQVENLQVLDSLHTRATVGWNADAAVTELEAGAGHDADGADEPAVVRDLDDPFADCPSLFAQFPERRDVAVELQLNAVLERLFVKYLHYYLAENGFAPARLDPSADLSDGEDTASHTLTGLLTILSLLHHVDAKMRFEDVDDLFKSSSQLSTITDFAEKFQSMPGEMLRGALVALVGGMDGDTRRQIEGHYSTITSLAKSCFAGVEGTFHVRVVSTSVRAHSAVQGLNVFTQFPTMSSILFAVEQRREQEARRQAELAALGDIRSFEEDDFEQLHSECSGVVDDSWTQVYPQDTNQHDWVNVWTKPHENGGSAFAKVRGIIAGVTAEQAFQHFANPDVRRAWDHMIAHCQIVRTFPEMNGDIFFSIFATPMNMQNREFLEFRQVQKRDDGGILMLARSCTDAAVPESSARTRATTLYSGYYFKTKETKRGPVAVLTGVVRQDLGGYIPGWIIDQLNERVIASWMHLMISSCVRAYASQEHTGLMMNG